MTPSRIKSSSKNDEDVEVKTPNGSVRRKAEIRKAHRDQLCDSNRPNLNEEFDSECDSDEEWADDDDELEKTTRLQMNESFRNIKQVERFKEKQKVKRFQNYTKNRRSSIGSTSTRYLSCLSLQSVDSSPGLFHSPKKSFTRNFIDSHYTELNRMSDYYVPARKLTDSACSDQNDNKQESWPHHLRDISFIVLGIAFAFGLMMYQKKNSLSADFT